MDTPPAAASPPAAYPEQEAALAVLALEHGLLDIGETARVLLESRRDGLAPLAEALARGLVNEADLLLASASELGVAFADLDDPASPYTVDREILADLDGATLETLDALPVREGDRVTVLAVQPSDARLLDWVAVTFPEANVVLTPAEQLREVLLTELATMATAQLATEVVAGGDSGGIESPVRRWLDATLDAAVAQRASDIHLQKDLDGTLKVRFRIDGVLVNQPAPPAGLEDNVLGAAMARANMDSSDRLAAQDSGFKFPSHGREVNVRASMMPTVTGPKVVYRVLDTAAMRIGLEQLGFSPEVRDLLTTAMGRSNGTMLVAGPTGSGKTTTMYSLLAKLTTDARNVSSVEDPVEYRLPGVSQTQVRVRAEDARKYSFSQALRTILRQDPDVIMIGEIRDLETATVAMEAALTGHLVLSSTHAPTAVATYSRLIRMGVPAYQVAQSVTLVLSQRLLRRVHSCATWVEPNPRERQLLYEIGAGDIDRVKREGGCPRCHHTGYRGRVAAAEILIPDRQLRAVVETGESADRIATAAESATYRPFRLDAARHLADGVTSVNEVLRVLEGLL